MSAPNPHAPLALIVEDEREIRTLFVEALATAGFTSLEAPNVEVAIAALEKTTPDVVFVDINMPGKLGTELIRHIKSAVRLRGVKIIVVTANPMAQEESEALGADLFLVKPVAIREMVMLASRLVRPTTGLLG
jgi:CheY-like chemotaxis protein